MATLHERVALVTGAGRGIGAAEAVRLAQAGARVAVLDLSEDLCWETVQRVRDCGGEAIAVACDVARTDQVTRASRGSSSTSGAWTSWSTTRESCGTTCSSE